MAKPINTESIEKATHKTWSEWTAELDSVKARELTHGELATTVRKLLEGTVENPSWWAQSITVAYEQHIGRRVPGQLADGTFEIAVSKTTQFSREVLFSRVVEWFGSQATLNNHEVLKPRSTETPKRSTWRCDFADKSKFSATVEGVGEKAKLVLAHTAIPSAEEAETWKSFWQSEIVRYIEK